MDDLVEERVGAGDGKVGEIAEGPAVFVDILRSEACCVYFVVFVVVVIVDEEEDKYPLLVFVASLLILALFDLAFKSCNETVDVDLLCV